MSCVRITIEGNKSIFPHNVQQKSRSTPWPCIIQFAVPNMKTRYVFLC